MLTTFPQCSFSLEFPEKLSQNHICYRCLSVWDFKNNVLWDTHCHAQSDIYFLYTDVRVDGEEAITRRHVVTPHVAVVCAR